MPEFDGKPLQSVAKGEVDLDSEGDTSEAEREEQQKEFADLLTWLKDDAGRARQGGAVVHRLTDSPACLVTDAFDMTPALARMYRAAGQEVPVGKRILELNPTHPLVTGLQQAHEDRPKTRALPRPPNCCTAPPFSPKAASSTIRPGSPRCSPSV